MFRLVHFQNHKSLAAARPDNVMLMAGEHPESCQRRDAYRLVTACPYMTLCRQRLCHCSDTLLPGTCTHWRIRRRACALRTHGNAGHRLTRAYKLSIVPGAPASSVLYPPAFNPRAAVPAQASAGPEPVLQAPAPPAHPVPGVVKSTAPASIKTGASSATASQSSVASSEASRSRPLLEHCLHSCVHTRPFARCCRTRLPG